MKFLVILPTAAGRKRGRQYLRVQVEPNGSPLRFEFRYMEIEHDDGGHELVCLESGVVQPTEDPTELDPDNLAAVTGAVVRDFREQWERYERAARATLATPTIRNWLRQARERGIEAS